MLSELANIREHWVRYRDVTLQHLDMLGEEHMAWRPDPELFSSIAVSRSPAGTSSIAVNRQAHTLLV